MFKIIIISVVCLVIGLFVLQQVDPNIQHEGGGNVSSLVVEDNKLKVTIEGEVVVPGIYKVEVSDTLQDLITLAGGLLESADQNAINLTTVIEDRDYFYVPSKSSYQNTCEIVAEKEKININTATAVQLSSLNYISVTLGEKIVAYREENGPFETLEDIMKVSGIGRATYEKIRDAITLK